MREVGFSLCSRRALVLADAARVAVGGVLSPREVAAATAVAALGVAVGVATWRAGEPGERGLKHAGAPDAGRVLPRGHELCWFAEIKKGDTCTH